eukprot:TRINITY_DN2255_c0_g1_i3.p1 TRINITY_DN2255_c0_g1~~TRINITY_DN2255_c0_g1_i3.p1  ORF type:complete len:132 (+),score=14.61 TRINITY_DN2255_c0_g1_i3:327-722(+)
MEVRSWPPAKIVVWRSAVHDVGSGANGSVGLLAAFVIATTNSFKQSTVWACFMFRINFGVALLSVFLHGRHLVGDVGVDFTYGFIDSRTHTVELFAALLQALLFAYGMVFYVKEREPSEEDNTSLRLRKKI